MRMRCTLPKAQFQTMRRRRRRQRIKALTSGFLVGTIITANALLYWGGWEWYHAIQAEIAQQEEGKM